ncbi:MAG: RNA polymerase sigma factor [Candidatus Hydrogenedentes bacterium]|nr:RNA polymerase sigma factor [Candidatus Hydrogenedentota bacterium]
MTSWEYELYVASIQRRIVNSIWRIVRDGPAVEDLVRDVIEQVVRKIGRVRAHPNPQALILRMAVQRALDFGRSRARRRSAMERYGRFQETRGPDNALAADIALREECDAVLGTLHRLPKREAEALWLHAVEGMSYAEVATTMGCRPATVRVLAARGRKRLKGCLLGGTSSNVTEDGGSCENT